MRSSFSAWGWAGIALLILGITLLVISYFQENSCSSHSFTELIGSIASITALVWVAMDNRLGMLGEEMKGMRGDMKRMREEMGGLREEMRGGFEKLPKRIAEELRELLKK